MILMLETFYGGSHKAFADGYRAHSEHTIDLVTLPGERWRSRIRTGAFELWPQVREPSRYRAILATDLIDLPDFLALWRLRTGIPAPPVLLYMHETQATYPGFSASTPHGHIRPRSAAAGQPGRDAERLAALQDIKNCLVADRVLFNSCFHREAFLDAVRALEASDPELALPDAAAHIEAKSGVVYPGVEMVGEGMPVSGEPPQGRKTPGADALGNANPAGTPTPAPLTRPDSAARSRIPGSRPPRILWNHRWDFDKRPGYFFRAAEMLADRGLDFELVVLGEAVWQSAAIARAREVLAGRIVHWGYAPDRDTYRRLVSDCEITVSTAIQENFGIAVVEAVSAGCIPALPRRLSYPELIPAPFHGSVFYEGDDDLVPHLEHLIRELPAVRQACRGLAAAMQRYSWQQIAVELDGELEALMP